MKVLLVEPDYRKGRPESLAQDGKGRTSDETLWYPPLGLMKLSRFHKDRGDTVGFVRGCDPKVFSRGDLFSPPELWDRVYITTLFTFHFDKVVKTIKFYLDAVGGTVGKIFVGGIMASLMAEDIYRETGIYPIIGVLNSPQPLRLQGDTNIDLIPPDYDLFGVDKTLYAVQDTLYAYTTRGCPNRCPWCGVPRIEPKYVPYIDIKPVIRELRHQYGDKANLCLMDNNVLPSPKLKQIVDDLLALGYGRGEYTDTQPRRQRVIDFNQGLDATHLTEKNMRLLAQLNIRPMRIAFDRLQEKDQYVRALGLAHRYGVPEFSNYMLYNFRDTPRDLYERLMINIELNESWIATEPGRIGGNIYSYPMRYAPIGDTNGNEENRSRDAASRSHQESRDWLSDPIWTRRFTRNIEIMKGAAHGAISATPTLARRTIGGSFEEFLANLYMPEELLRNRNRYERHVYPHEPKRKAGTGKVEEFRTFILDLLKTRNARFLVFHNAVSPNSAQEIRAGIEQTNDQELRKWLRMYIKD